MGFILSGLLSFTLVIETHEHVENVEADCSSLQTYVFIKSCDPCLGNVNNNFVMIMNEGNQKTEPIRRIF